MKAFFVVTVTCPDHPGIVARISSVLLAYQANWEDSRMARLGGVFAGIIKISADEAQAAALKAALQALTDNEMTVVVQPSKPIEPYQDYTSLHLTLSGADHEGIIHGLADYLAGRGVNVEELTTEVANAPWSGGSIFKAHAELKVPPGLSYAELKSALADIAALQGVDILLEPS